MSVTRSSKTNCRDESRIICSIPFTSNEYPLDTQTGIPVYRYTDIPVPVDRPVFLLYILLRLPWHSAARPRSSLQQLAQLTPYYRRGAQTKTFQPPSMIQLIHIPRIRSQDRWRNTRKAIRISSGHDRGACRSMTVVYIRRPRDHRTGRRIFTVLIVVIQVAADGTGKINFRKHISGRHVNIRTFTCVVRWTRMCYIYSRHRIDRNRQCVVYDRSSAERTVMSRGVLYIYIYIYIYIHIYSTPSW